MIVIDGVIAGEEMRLVAEPRGRFVNDAFDPWGGVFVAIDVEVGVADHIGQQECFDLFGGAVLLPFLRKMACAVETVGVGPRFHGFLGVGPEQPNAVAVALFAAKLVRELKQKSAGGGAVVGSDKRCFTQRIVRVVMAGDDNYAVF